LRAIEVLKEEGLSALLRKAFVYIRLEFLILPYALIKVKKANFASLDDLVDFCFHGIGGLVKPLQVREEILGLLKILKEKNPGVVIEIGTYSGGTLFLLSRVAAEDATIISIDFPDVRFGGGYPLWRIPLYKAFILPKQRLHLIRADSHSPETLSRVKEILVGNKVDLLFIDGDHSYEGVKKDFQVFSRLVKNSGIIAIHDIVIHPIETGVEVNRLWDEIKESKYEYTEIVSDWNQGTCGIGVLFINSKG
jgi:predicted O-methyltransferase YrrM